ncbi:MAG: GntR family transcriptional regulator [Acidobacteria bacterium]|nr:GntR family transcriptional regulator [Acidobacteriota bacterium]MCI0719785.1 GntR family transcriptional regulator [Acidobacteriota bacterium]
MTNQLHAPAASAPSARRGQLKAQAYKELKRLLLMRGFGPEAFLSEREFARRLNMSLAPVRSAIERLAAEGLILVSPQRGIQVSEPSNREIADHYELRTVLEPFVCRRIAGRLNPDQVQRLRGNIEALDVGAGIDRFMEIDTGFHIMLAEFYGNGEITRAMTQLRDKITRVIVRAFEETPERLAAGIQEHRQIAEAVINGEPDLADKLMLEHIQSGMKSVLPSGAWR